VIVLDASIAVKWFLPESDSEAARALYSERLSAPAIWISEVANVLWHHVRTARLSDTRARQLLQKFRRAPITSVDLGVHIEQALVLANEISHPVYDCLYLALAIEEDTVLLTADLRFARAVRAHGKWAQHVRVLGEH
jgi:predicted nucleic acid-binding protein